ncbi:MAG: hypothetical protein ACYC2K_18610 [Gemmatimonadales bacterium]
MATAKFNPFAPTQTLEQLAACEVDDQLLISNGTVESQLQLIEIGLPGRRLAAGAGPFGSIELIIRQPIREVEATVADEDVEIW